MDGTDAVRDGVVRLVARFEVADVLLSTSDYARVTLTPLVPEEEGDWTDEQWEAWTEANAQFHDPQRDGLDFQLNTDDVRPGQIVTLTMEIADAPSSNSSR